MEIKGTYEVETMDESMSEISVFMDKLSIFVKDWKQAARIEELPLDAIEVNLVSVLEDFCEILEILPSDIGLE